MPKHAKAGRRCCQKLLVRSLGNRIPALVTVEPGTTNRCRSFFPFRSVCHVVDVGVHSLPPASRLRPRFLPVAHCVAACSDYLHGQRASETLPSKTLITPHAPLSSANHATPECSDGSGRTPGDDRCRSEWGNKINGNVCGLSNSRTRVTSI